MHSIPLLSIIVPVYNTEQTVRRTVECVLAQTLTDWELILVNDGSTDGSLAICEELAEKDDRIRVISQENAGQSVARNVALEEASGEYVTFLDSDDTIVPDTYASVIDVFLSDPDCQIVQYPYDEIRPAETIPSRITQDKRIDGTINIMRLWSTEQSITGISCDKVYKRELFQHVSYCPRILFEDNLMLGCLLTKVSVYHITTRGRYLYFQTHYTPDKWQWSPRKSKDQMTVFCESLKHYLTLDDRFDFLKAEYIRRITNAIWVEDKVKGPCYTDIARSAREVFALISTKALLTKYPLSLKARIKALYMRSKLR